MFHYEMSGEAQDEILKQIDLKKRKVIKKKSVLIKLLLVDSSCLL